MSQIIGELGHSIDRACNSIKDNITKSIQRQYIRKVQQVSGVARGALTIYNRAGV